ncbi:MAG: glycosyltransferase, partial [Candidatus Thorarchaeota archaeon]
MIGKVCFITSYFPPVSIGGVERYILNISESLQKEGIDSSIITRHYFHLPRYERQESFEVFRVGLNPIPQSRFRQLRYISQLLSPITYIESGIGAAIAISKDANVIHSQLGTLHDLNFGIKLSLKTKKKHIVTVHGRFGRESEDIPPEIVESLLQSHYIIVNRKESLEYLSEKGAR